MSTTDRFAIQFPSLGKSETKAHGMLSIDYGDLRTLAIAALKKAGVENPELSVETAAITKLANARSNGYPPNWTKRFGLTYGQALLSQVLDTAAERMEAPWHTAFELAAFKLLDQLATEKHLDDCKTGPSEWTTLVFSSNNPADKESWTARRVDVKTDGSAQV